MGIGDGQEHGDDPAWDALEAEAMYTLLEQEVVPDFYERDERGLPAKWLGRIRESMCQLTPEFSVGRTLREYTKHHYLPAASGYAQRAAKENALGADLLEWQQNHRSTMEHRALRQCECRNPRQLPCLPGTGLTG